MTSCQRVRRDSEAKMISPQYFFERVTSIWAPDCPQRGPTPGGVRGQPG
jgi:hypothetical protein